MSRSLSCSLAVLSVQSELAMQRICHVACHVVTHTVLPNSAAVHHMHRTLKCTALCYCFSKCILQVLQTTTKILCYCCAAALLLPRLLLLLRATVAAAAALLLLAVSWQQVSQLYGCFCDDAECTHITVYLQSYTAPVLPLCIAALLFAQC
jgi:hypothetical protein